MNNPKNSETNLAGDFQLDFLGGIGMYHTKAHTNNNTNKFKFSASPKV
jgi:hypothetical protein